MLPPQVHPEQRPIPTMDSILTTSVSLPPRDSARHVHAPHLGSCVTLILRSTLVLLCPYLVLIMFCLCPGLLHPLMLCRVRTRVMKGRPCSMRVMRDTFRNMFLNSRPLSVKGISFLRDMVHQLGVREHEKSLIARVLLKPKVEPMTNSALCASINKIWDVPGAWKFLTLGMGYYSIHIMNHVELECLLARRIWNFQHGTVKLQCWTP